MRQNLRSFLWITAAFVTPLAIAGITCVLIKQHRLAQAMAGTDAESSAMSCQTIIADPNPPLNVRSSPVVSPDNRIGILPNGTPLTIVDENEGWLHISTPLRGWVYKELTVTTCGSLAEAANASLPGKITSSPTDSGTGLLAIATEQYHSGNLNGAIALAKTVPPQSPAYRRARTAVVQWQADWTQAESEFYTTQKAMRDGQWQAVLDRVEGFPNIRFWKEKMAPLVKRAMEETGKGPGTSPKKGAS
jgi:hypothetical protein